MFDLVCGVSAGGWVALGIRASVRPAKMIDLFKTMAAKVFDKGWNLSRIVFGGARYDSDKLSNLASEYFGEGSIIGEKSYSFVVSRTNLGDTPFLWCHYEAPPATLQFDGKPGGLYPDLALSTMKSAALATSAAPTFFSPVTVPVFILFCGFSGVGPYFK